MEQLSALGLEELNKRKSTLKLSLASLIISCVIMLLINLYVFIFKSKPVSPGSLIPLFVILMTWIPMFSSLKSVNEEIKSRKSTNLSNH